VPKDWAAGLSQRHAPGKSRPRPDGAWARCRSPATALLPTYCDFRTIRLRQIAEDHTIGNVVAGAGVPAPVLGRAPGRQDRLSGRYRPAESAGLATATCWALTGSARSQKTDRTFMYKLWAPHPPARRPGGRPGPGRVSVSRLTLYHRATALHARQAGSRPPLTAEDRRAQISGDLRAQQRPRERPPPPSCPMLPGLVAYHRRDNLPGQNPGANKAPWTIRQDHPGGKALRHRNPCHAT